MGKTLNASVPIKMKDGGTFWHSVGRAWVSDKGHITLVLNSLPLPDRETGETRIMLFEKKDDDGPRGGGRGRDSNPSVDLDGEVPF